MVKKEDKIRIVKILKEIRKEQNQSKKEKLKKELEMFEDKYKIFLF